MLALLLETIGGSLAPSPCIYIIRYYYDYSIVIIYDNVVVHAKHNDAGGYTHNMWNK